MDKPASPIIIETDANKSANFGNSNSSSLLPRLVFLVLALVVVIEIIVGVRSLRSVQSSKLAVVARSTGTMMLISEGKNYHVGDLIKVNVQLKTGNHNIVGVDALIHFDKSRLEASDSGVVVGSILDSYPVHRVSQDKGLIEISGIASNESLSFNGTGIFATINLKATQKGITTVSIEFDKGKTNNSNLVDKDSNLNILNQVGSVNLNIL